MEKVVYHPTYGRTFIHVLTVRNTNWSAEAAQEKLNCLFYVEGPQMGFLSRGQHRAMASLAATV